MGQARAADASWELRVCADPYSLPFSARDESGFENRIAGLLADQLGARLTYDWHAFNSDLIDLELREGRCDLLMGVPDGYRNLLNTIAYYQSPYVFLYRADSGLAVTSLDDPILADLRIGVSSFGIPPHESLVKRGLSQSVVAAYGTNITDVNHLEQVVAAVGDGDIDLGIAWGPVAGYYASRQSTPITVVPVSPAFDPPSTIMTIPMTIGVRQGDLALRDRLNLAITQRWDDIQAVLAEYGVPVEATVRPRPPTAEPPGFRIGVVIPTLTGRTPNRASIYDIVGDAARMGALQAEEELGTSGPGGVDVRLASAPSAGAAIRAAERLLALSRVQALIGGIGDGEAEALAELTEARGVPFLNVGSASELLRDACYANTFHVEASGAMYLDALVAWFAGRGLTHWFVVFDDSAEGGALRDRALHAIASWPAPLAVAGAAGVAANQAVYSATLDALGNSGADVVLLLLDGPDQIAFAGQLENRGLPVEVATFPYPVTQTRDFLAALPSRAGEAGVGDHLALWETSLTGGPYGDLNERFTSRWGKPMDPSAWAAYEAVRILRQAADAAASPDPAALLAALAVPEATYDVDKGPGVSFRPGDHQLRQPLYVVRIDPDAEWGLALGKQVAIARLQGELPGPRRPGESATQRLDRLGGSDEERRCSF